METSNSMGVPAASRRFEPIRELGRGGMGVVYLVYDSVRRQELALKRMLRFGERDIRRFKREFRAIEELHHPNILSVYELGVDAEGLYLLMEALEGRDVWAWCRASAASSTATR